MCIRDRPYVKGMLHEVDFKDFLTLCGTDTITDLWGMELAELAAADGHIHHDAAAHGVIKIFPNEGQPRLPAHAADVYKRQLYPMADILP